MDNGKTNSAAYLLKPHGNFPLSIIHYQFSKFHNLFLTQRQFLHSFRCYNPRVFDTNGTNARQNNFRLQCKDHTRLQLLLHTRSQYRHFIDFQTDAMTDKLGLLSGSHKVVGKACFGDNIDSEIVKVLTNSTRFRFSTTASCMSRQT